MIKRTCFQCLINVIVCIIFGGGTAISFAEQYDAAKPPVKISVTKKHTEENIFSQTRFWDYETS
ncbi:MAG: hypothetical protein ACRC2T_10055 [Thermoguttaceae bacterium]